MKTIQLLLVDDQTEVRRGLRMRLSLEPDIVIVGEAASGQAALDLAERTSPDVVVMDVEMPGMDGIETTRRLRDERPCAVVMLTIHDDAGTRQAAVQAGASAFVAKSQPATALLSEIRRAAGEDRHNPPAQRAS